MTGVVRGGKRKDRGLNQRELEFHGLNPDLGTKSMSICSYTKQVLATYVCMHVLTGNGGRQE